MKYFLKFSILPIILIISNCHVDKPLRNIEYRTVDCSFNKYFITNLCEDEKEYLDWADKYPNFRNIADLTEEKLNQINKDTLDVDKATSVFYHRLIQEPSTKKLMNHLALNSNHKSKRKKQYRDLSGTTILMIPGMFYMDNKEVGADGKSLRLVANKVGIKDLIIPISQAGTTGENAIIICNFLETMELKDKLIIASASKGSADFIKAIELCGANEFFSNIVGWINIGGLNRGTHLVEAIDENWRYRWEAKMYFLVNGYNYQGLQSLYRNGTISPKSLAFIRKIKTINIIGVPLFRHVTDRARPFYEYLIRFGPNDGMTLLWDSYLEGAFNYPSWRNDHYFQNPFKEEDIISILDFILNK